LVTERFEAGGVQLVPDIEAGLPAISVDPVRMGQVLGNLLDNALRHTPEGGTVTIRAARAIRATRATGATRSGRAGGIELSVTDTGDGIPAEHLPKIFERFYRVDAARDRAHGGSGIGLAIAKALVEAHGGQIAGNSAGTGKGSTFRVLLACP
jgi:signal transduction histidine kinase